jgi:glycerol-3-phosphate dehydrogenase
MNTIKADVAVIGAGITGCAIARQLSKYMFSTLVIEKEADVGWGTTKANTGLIHSGYAGEKGSLKLNLCHNGNKLFRKNASELDIPIQNTGSLLNIFNQNQVRILEENLKQGKVQGLLNLEIISNKNGALKKLEPNISKNVIAGLYADEACIISPYEAAIALYENAKKNSARFMLASKVTSIEYEKSQKCFFIKIQPTSREHSIYGYQPGLVIAADYVINAAGIYADEIAKMVGDLSFEIKAVKGQYYLLDSEAGGLVKRPNMRISDPETKKSKGMVVAPTTGNNIIVGSTYEDTDKDDYSTTKEALDEVKMKLGQMIENIPFDKTITIFAGLRAISNTGDFIISQSPANKKFINAAGIQSPGLTCAFIISEIIEDHLKEAGLKLEKNTRFIPERKRFPKLDNVNFDNNQELFASSSGYGEIICRCEKVSEAEIINAIKNGATTLDGVKFRTRAGMGRCQGGYCTLRVMKLLSKELRIPIEKITKSGGDSYQAKIEMNK